MREAMRVTACLPVLVIALLVLVASAVGSTGAQPATIVVENPFASSQIRLSLIGIKSVRDTRTGIMPSAPTWIVRNAAGATVATGKFEYG